MMGGTPACPQRLPACVITPRGGTLAAMPSMAVGSGRGHDMRHPPKTDNMRKLLSTMVAAMMATTMTTAENKDGGINYFLPKTVVQVALKIEKTTFTPGNLAAYSDLYFKTKAAMEPSVSYRIVGIDFYTTAVADSAKQFSGIIDKKHSILSLDCDRNGVLLAINAKAPQPKQPPVFRTAPQQKPLNPQDFMSQDILNSGNLPTMARLVAQEIYDIRDSRSQLSRGEADFMPKDGAQLKLMLDQLNTQERALSQVFTGTTVRDTTQQVVAVVPTKGVAKQLAFRFSRHFGLTANDDLAGEPYYAVVEDENVIAEMPATKDDKKQKDDMVLGVNMPGKIKLQIVHDGKALAQFGTQAAQFGRVETISGALFGKKMTSHIVLDAVTGNIISLTTEPLE